MEKTSNILVVEDEKPLSDAIRAKLEREGFQVVTARSVKEGIGLVEDTETIDAVWLDHYLVGKEDGLDFVAHMKSSPKWRKMPIFVVSNTATPDKIQSYIDLGIEKYYAKVTHRLDDIIADIRNSLLKEAS